MKNISCNRDHRTMTKRGSGEISNRSALSAVALMLASNGALALNNGTDMNLGYKPAAGGMAGAAYTRPQDVSSALFGNPATLTQFKGGNVSLGASYMDPLLEVKHSQGSFSNTSESDARRYIVPDFALSLEPMPGTVFGLGVELDAGLGADFRNDRITAGPDGVIRLPLNVEVISFNANLGLAHQLTPQLAVGGALTLGFGLAQLGTTGNTSGMSAALGSLGLSDFGGTTSSVHDIGAGASLGLTYQPAAPLTLSAAVKSPVKYNFKNILSTTVRGSQQYQSLEIEQPLEVVLGGAYDITPTWMVEADAVWKNWSNAKTYEDIYKDQTLVLLGTQYKTGAWSLRAGYSYASKILRDEPNGTLGGLTGLGTLPLNTAVPPIDLAQNGLAKLVQMTLVPVITQHTLAAGFGYNFTPGVRADVWGTYAFQEKDRRDIGGVIGSYEAQFKQWAVGAGLSLKF